MSFSVFIFFIFFVNSFSKQGDDLNKVKGKSKDVKVDLVDQSFQADGRTVVEYKDIEVEAKHIKKVEDENRIIAKEKIVYT